MSSRFRVWNAQLYVDSAASKACVAAQVSNVVGTCAGLMAQRGRRCLGLEGGRDGVMGRLFDVQSAFDRGKPSVTVSGRRPGTRRCMVGVNTTLRGGCGVGCTTWHRRPWFMSIQCFGTHHNGCMSRRHVVKCRLAQYHVAPCYGLRSHPDNVYAKQRRVPRRAPAGDRLLYALGVLPCLLRLVPALPVLGHWHLLPAVCLVRPAGTGCIAGRAVRMLLLLAVDFVLAVADQCRALALRCPAQYRDM